MKKLMFVLSLVALLSLPISMMAADYPKAEVFGGYSYQHVEGGFNLNGWNASVAGNFNPWLGLVADLSGQYNDFNSHSFLFGPQLTYRGNDRVTPFAHVLIGAVHHSGGGIFSNTAFATAFGGGVDVKLKGPVAARLIQVDYIMTRFNGQTQNDARLSFGLVFRF